MDPPRHLNSQGDSSRLMGEVEASHTPGGIRTPNPLIRSQMLYPVELPVHSEEVVTMSLAINQVNAFEGFGGCVAKRLVFAG